MELKGDQQHFAFQSSAFFSKMKEEGQKSTLKKVLNTSAGAITHIDKVKNLFYALFSPTMMNLVPNIHL
jgi:hypothetical protein